MEEANRNYYESDDPYYFFDRDMKEHIVEVCIDRYFRDNNVSSDVSGWRFTLNQNRIYFGKHKLYEKKKDYDKKYSNSLRFLESKGYTHVGFQRTSEIDQTVDCNKPLEVTYHNYFKEWGKFFTKEHSDNIYNKNGPANKFENYINNH